MQHAAHVCLGRTRAHILLGRPTKEFALAGHLTLRVSTRSVQVPRHYRQSRDAPKFLPRHFARFTIAEWPLGGQDTARALLSKHGEWRVFILLFFMERPIGQRTKI
jgi:hypothetical protein